MTRAHRFAARRIPLSACLLAMSLALFQAAALAAGTTAVAGLDQARHAAKQWNADAALVQITTYSADFDGTADGWICVFHSPSASKGLNVNVKGGRVSGTIKVSATFRDRIDGDFIDSAQAMGTARKHDVEKLTRARAGEVTMMLLPAIKAGARGLYWTVIGDWDSGKSIVIDAKSGDFVRIQATK